MNPLVADQLALSAVVNWVEKGIAPDNLDQPANWSASRSRPLCPHPKKALLKAGATDVRQARRERGEKRRVQRLNTVER
ncbi:tannase/feruloyl esterase family alpha/beta hydrolase [Ramlibacter sp. WS9]|uniref:tannase/feruloyl esterase family alpha/beta hydrolase n=1 Tax=Ramlibacter sp. WS9 TaxID=1882741 RepID=UPI003515E8D7